MREIFPIISLCFPNPHHHGNSEVSPEPSPGSFQLSGLPKKGQPSFGWGISTGQDFSLRSPVRDPPLDWVVWPQNCYFVAFPSSTCTREHRACALHSLPINCSRRKGAESPTPTPKTFPHCCPSPAALPAAASMSVEPQLTASNQDSIPG